MFRTRKEIEEVLKECEKNVVKAPVPMAVMSTLILGEILLDIRDLLTNSSLEK